MLALIDADIPIYRVGFTSETDPIEVATQKLDEMMEGILEATKATKYRAFLTATNDLSNFRRRVFPAYKANRIGKPKPVHYAALRKHLEDEWNAEVVYGIEADDALGIHQTPESVVISVDKDLLQIQGRHYNFVKDLWYDITPEEGSRRFYAQMITGDASDNIKGVPRKGEVAAMKALDGINDDETMFGIVYDLYQEAFGSDLEMFRNGLCLWVLRHQNDSYAIHWEDHMAVREGFRDDSSDN